MSKKPGVLKLGVANITIRSDSEIQATELSKALPTLLPSEGVGKAWEEAQSMSWESPTNLGDLVTCFWFIFRHVRNTVHARNILKLIERQETPISI